MKNFFKGLIPWLFLVICLISLILSSFRMYFIFLTKPVGWLFLRY